MAKTKAQLEAEVAALRAELKGKSRKSVPTVKEVRAAVKRAADASKVALDLASNPAKTNADKLARLNAASAASLAAGSGSSPYSIFRAVYSDSEFCESVYGFSLPYRSLALNRAAFGDVDREGIESLAEGKGPAAEEARAWLDSNPAS